MDMLDLRKWVAALALSVGLTAFADEGKPLYENNFESAKVGEIPTEFLVLDGAYAVQEDGGNKFLELPGSPLETFSVLFGPTQAEGVSVSARIFGTGKGRRFPTFSIGLNGNAGYKLQVSPAKDLIELYKGEAVKTSVPFKWSSAKWSRLQLAVHPGKDGTWKIEGSIWADGESKPATPTVVFEEKEKPAAGRASITGCPFSNTPIRFDDLAIRTLAN